MKSSDFLSLDSEQDIYKRASLLVERINGIMRIRMGSFRNIGIEAVIQIDDQSVLHRSVWLHAEPGIMRMKSGPVTLKIEPLQEESIKGSREKASRAAVLSWPEIAERDNHVAKALRLFEQELNWLNLYKISEVIFEDQGKEIIEKGWATLEEVNLFRETANCCRAIGDAARHARDKDRPPAMPLALGEAQALIRRVASRWLEEKSRPRRKP